MTVRHSEKGDSGDSETIKLMLGIAAVRASTAKPDRMKLEKTVVKSRA